VTLTAARLEHAYAFDQAAAWLDQLSGPLLAVLSAREFVDLVLARATQPLLLGCDDPNVLQHARTRLEEGLLPLAIGRDSRALSAVEGLGSDQRFGRALWASPQTTTAPAKLAALARLLLPGGRLCVLVRTGLSHRPGRDRQPCPLPESVRRGLASTAWCPSPDVCELGGYTSLGWAVAGRLATLAQRADLADRAERAHHLALQSPRIAAYQLLLFTRSADCG
jgi:hypothetical protein